MGLKYMTQGSKVSFLRPNQPGLKNFFTMEELCHFPFGMGPSFLSLAGVSRKHWCFRL
jgi:hypothetical protein